MPRECTICAHPEAAAIDTALVDGVPNRRIATQHGLSEAAVRRHAKDHLPLVIAAGAQATQTPPKRRTEPAHAPALVEQAAAQQAQQATHAIDVMAELARCFQRITLLQDACDAWLRDPRDPSRYDVGPRASDVEVIYEITDRDGNVIEREHARLSWLWAAVERQARAQGTRLKILKGETKVADPRKLVIEATAQIVDQVRLLADLLERVRNVERMERMEAAIVAALRESTPDVAESVLAALEPDRLFAGAARPD